jgi:hypothetical protein
MPGANGVDPVTAEVIRGALETVEIVAIGDDLAIDWAETERLRKGRLARS